MAPKDTVVYQRFFEYTKKTTDPYWKSQFKSMVSGEFPEGFSLSSSGDTIISDDGRKLKLKPDDDPISIFDNAVNIRQFIEGTEKSGSSKKDTVNDWKAIKSKETRYHLISDFSKTFQADPDKKRRTIDQINFCIQLKLIDPSDIHMKGGKVVSIEGIKIDRTGNVKIPTIGIPKKSSANKKKKNILRGHIERMIKENQQRLEKLSP